jgi:preprotein translocase subunit YajC
METAAQSGTAFMWWILLAFVLFMIWFPARSQKKQEQERKNRVDALKKGDQVVIPNGIIGTVAGFKDNAIEVKIAEGIKLTVLKTAIVGFVNENQPAANEGGAK